LCLLGLATLRSPCLPQDYAQLVPLWLLTLLPGLASSLRRFWPIVPAWVVLNVGLPMEGFAALGTVPSLIVTAIPQSLHWALVFGVLSRLLAKGLSLTPQSCVALTSTRITGRGFSGPR
jgi:hypothetical protein